jgi:hypothetical protein
LELQNISYFSLHDFSASPSFETVPSCLSCFQYSFLRTPSLLCYPDSSHSWRKLLISHLTPEDWFWASKWRKSLPDEAEDVTGAVEQDKGLCSCVQGKMSEPYSEYRFPQKQTPQGCESESFIWETVSEEPWHKCMEDAQGALVRKHESSPGVLELHLTWEPSGTVWDTKQKSGRARELQGKWGIYSPVLISHWLMADLGEGMSTFWHFVVPILWLGRILARGDTSEGS